MEQQFREIAALVGDPTRATILWTLLDGKAMPATELALAADTSPQNISMHLSRLLQAGLLSAERHGRHRYYRFSGHEVAYAVEAMASLIRPAARQQAIVENISPVKYCRTCYDHLAGKIGVAVTDSLLKQKIITAGNGRFDISRKGSRWFMELGIDAAALQQERRSFLRPCLDWSERRPHIAGSLAASLLDKMLSGDWIRRTRGSRAIVITAKGKKYLHEYFKLSA